MRRAMHITALGDDPWYFAAATGECFHLQRNCRGLRNARVINRATSVGDKNRALILNNLRPCRLCVSNPVLHEWAGSSRATTADDAPEESRTAPEMREAD